MFANKGVWESLYRLWNKGVFIQMKELSKRPYKGTRDIEEGGWDIHDKKSGRWKGNVGEVSRRNNKRISAKKKKKNCSEIQYLDVNFYKGSWKGLEVNMSINEKLCYYFSLGKEVGKGLF